MTKNKYDIARDFSEGVVAALAVNGIDPAKSEHWQAGYGAGYAMRAEKNRRLNEYLVSIGQEPMSIVRLAQQRS